MRENLIINNPEFSIIQVSLSDVNNTLTHNVLQKETDFIHQIRLNYVNV